MEHFILHDESSADTLAEQIESSVLDMIKKHNPQWVETDGSCKKCMTYYENLDKLIVQEA